MRIWRGLGRSTLKVSYYVLQESIYAALTNTGAFFTDNLPDTMSTYTTHKNPAVCLGPTLAGGVGAKAIRKFYETEFLQTKPPSMRLRLLSRTVGADRVVDEIFTSFDHTLEMPWILPGVPPTGKKVELIIVAVIALKCEKIFTEHLYWDQASVLVQVGLLDPKLIPQGVKGVKTLPVSGREAARRILGEHPARGEEFHQKIIASAKATGTKSTRASRQSTPRPTNRVGGGQQKQVEQRNVSTTNGQHKTNGESSNLKPVNGKASVNGSHASGYDSTSTTASRKPKKLGTPKKDKGKAPEEKKEETNGIANGVDKHDNEDKDKEAQDENEQNGVAENGKAAELESQETANKEAEDFADGESEAAPPTPSRPMAARVESAGLDDQ